MSQVTGRAQLLRAPGVSRTGQAPFRRVCASARSPHSVSHVNRRAALIAAGLISTVQALAAEEKPTSEKYATEYPSCLQEALTVFVKCQEAFAVASKSFLPQQKLWPTICAACRSVTETLPHVDQEPPQYLPMMEEIDQLGEHSGMSYHGIVITFLASRHPAGPGYACMYRCSSTSQT